MAKGNWVKIHREIENHWLWQKKPFSPGQAWIDIILKANHKDNKLLVDGDFITIKRGQILTSIRILGDRWGWSRTKVCRFLSCLESDRNLLKKSDTKKTVLTLNNYSLYQDKEDTKKTPKRHGRDTVVTRSDTNKNVKNVKNGKKEKISREKFSPPSIEVLTMEFQSKGFTGEAGKRESEKFFNHYESKGWMVGVNKMKKWKAAVAGWVIRNKEKEQKQIEAKTPADNSPRSEHPREDWLKMINESIGKELSVFEINDLPKIKEMLDEPMYKRLVLTLKESKGVKNE